MSKTGAAQQQCVYLESLLAAHVPAASALEKPSATH
jgi:hypothetical protein